MVIFTNLLRRPCVSRRPNNDSRPASYGLFCHLVFVLLLLTACSDAPHLPRIDAEAVILSFGDSLTRGKGAGDDESYPAVLERLSGRRVINAGVSGELSGEGLQRLPALLDRHRPALLILCHGGNDLLRQMDLDRMGANLRQMISLAAARGVPVILLGVPLPGIFLSTAEVYDEIAGATGVIYIDDLMTEILSDSSLKSDRVHPNGEGYRRIAEAVHEVLVEHGAI